MEREKEGEREGWKEKERKIQSKPRLTVFFLLSGHFPPLMDEETESQKLCDLPKVTSAN